MSNLPTGKREHRTACVIDTRGGASGEFKERYNRLLESLNGQNIKADVYTLADEVAPVQASGGFYHGHPDSPPAALPQYPSSNGLTPQQIAAWASGEGYSQLLLVVGLK